MKIEIVRLGSLVMHGVGGPGAAAIGLIYSMLLQEYRQDLYSMIVINQIDEKLDEVIVKHGSQVNVNVRYPARQDIESLSELEQNKMRIGVLHEGLVRIAQHYKKLDIEILNRIREQVLKNSFEYSFKLKSFINKKTRI
jgi:hypothetical protein